MNIENLMKKITINGKEIKNRVVLPPMSLLGSNADGTVTPRMIQGYESWAKGGFGLIITEGLYVDDKSSRGALNQPGLENENQANSWKEIVKFAHENNAVIVAQLAHIGSLGNNPNGNVAPSAISLNPQLPAPHELTVDEIIDIENSFVKSAKLALMTGFDGIEIHAAMGLIEQFINPSTNKRSDNYGGTVENRMRILTEIISKISENVPKDFIIGIRILENEQFTMDEMKKYFEILNSTNAHYLNTSEKDALKVTKVDPDHTFSELAKIYTDKIVIAAGGLGIPENAVKAIEKSDMIAVGKLSLSNPDWVNKVKNDQEIAPFKGFM